MNEDPRLTVSKSLMLLKEEGTESLFIGLGYKENRGSETRFTMNVVHCHLGEPQSLVLELNRAESKRLLDWLFEFRHKVTE